MPDVGRRESEHLGSCAPQPHMQEAEADSFTGLEGLLGGEEPHATFHDACLLDIAVNYDARLLSAHIEVCVGDPESTIEWVRERRRLGQLSLSGLKLWSIDPPLPESGQLGPLWLTDEGRLSDAPTRTGRELGAAVSSHEAAGYLYFSNLNSFAYYRAESATFAWV